MRVPFKLLPIAAIVLASSLQANAAVFYTETFANSTGALANMASVGWSAYLSATAVDANVSTAGGAAPVSNLAGADGAPGFGAKTSSNSVGIYFTTEPGTVTQDSITSLSFYSNNTNGTAGSPVLDTYRFVVRVGSSYFATDATFGNTTQGTSAGFPAGVSSTAQLQTFAFSTAAWRPVSLTPGGGAPGNGTLALGATAAALPAGDISAFGLFSNSNPGGTLRFDNFSISVIPEPGTLVSVIAGAGLAALRRGRRVGG